MQTNLGAPTSQLYSPIPEIKEMSMLQKKMIPLLAFVLMLAVTADPAAARFKFHIGHGDRLEGSGDLETRHVDLEDFNRIRLDGGMDLNIRFGNKASAEITLDDNLMDNLIIEVQNGTLLIDFEESCDTDGDSRIDIVMPGLERLVINGAGDIVISELKGKSFELKLDGACDLDMDGKVGYFEIDLNGAGDINARRLEADEVDVHISGAGDVDVTATKKIDASISGVGRISYWGDPEHERTRVSGIGDIDRK